ncbi:MAG: hypothetical protein B7Z75_00135 [Acidocella sp. 20-57-95]|nr:MAG: hypothetical protein B7Z75_00135 [Acidocella sp. 20-57-95]OYV60628.1 MAG: hypothetical protein B7Z71_05935 [Acidocella sp. 21-58-7]HQT63357.1 hypothetical protein [Acidocella sp.]HQU03208.1 hypothetical protein [Acidocella sp.]
MIRPLTLLTMMLAAGSGAYLFAVKHKAQVLDDQLASVAQQTRLDEQRIRVLQAQWALETAPPRLKQLAAQFTDLQPMKPAQLVTLASLETSLPPPGKVAPIDNPVAPMPPQITAAAPPVAAPPVSSPPVASLPVTAPVAQAPVPQKFLAAAAPAPAPVTAPVVPPVAMASATPTAMPKIPQPAAVKPAPAVKLASVAPHHPVKPSQPASRLAAKSAPHDVSHLAPTVVAETLPPPHAAAPVYHSSAYHVPAAPRPEIASAVSGGGSALAMAADLPPPRPYSESSN